jgi:hypothetical protein
VIYQLQFTPSPLMMLSAKLAKEKNQLLLSSKQIMEKIVTLEADIGNKVRNVNVTADSTISKDRKLFHEAQEERIQKVWRDLYPADR